MIEKSRLEELIKNKQPIYYSSLIQKVLTPSKWKNGYRIFDKLLAKLDKNGLTYWQYFYDSMFETKEDAEFALRYKHIPRTEYLDLPTWEEIKNKENYKITFWVKDKYYEFFCNWSSYRGHHYLSINENYMFDEEWCWVNLLSEQTQMCTGT